MLAGPRPLSLPTPLPTSLCPTPAPLPLSRTLLPSTPTEQPRYTTLAVTVENTGQKSPAQVALLPSGQNPNPTLGFDVLPSSPPAPPSTLSAPPPSALLIRLRGSSPQGCLENVGRREDQENYKTRRAPPPLQDPEHPVVLVMGARPAPAHRGVSPDLPQAHPLVSQLGNPPVFQILLCLVWYLLTHGCPPSVSHTEKEAHSLG